MSDTITTDLLVCDNCGTVYSELCKSEGDTCWAAGVKFPFSPSQFYACGGTVKPFRATNSPAEDDHEKAVSTLAMLLDDASRSLRQADTTPRNVAEILIAKGVRGPAEQQEGNPK